MIFIYIYMKASPFKVISFALFEVALEMPPESCTSALQGAMDVGAVRLCLLGAVAGRMLHFDASFFSGSLRKIMGNQ